MKPEPLEAFNPGIGATPELSLRVSVAMLVRVVFANPADGVGMLALERKATLQPAENGTVVAIKAQPFGGAVRIRDWQTLQDLAGGFHFDSESSRSEQDFRIFIRPTAWGAVRQFCLEQLSRADNPLLETGPERELAEEFADALKISLRSVQYKLKPIAILIEDDPAPTHNIHARGQLTVRVYRIFEAAIVDPALAQAMLHNSLGITNQDLAARALADARRGGKGRANAVLALPMKLLGDVYSAMPLEERNGPVVWEQNRLDETVAALLEGISVPKYHNL